MCDIVVDHRPCIAPVINFIGQDPTELLLHFAFLKKKKITWIG